jgi:CopG family nickel-responsive transcriptional regulator
VLLKELAMNRTIRFGISLPRSLLSSFDRLISRKGYANRSEAIRDLIRKYLVEREWEGGKKETVGTVTLVYDHEKKDLGSVLTSLQHRHTDSVVSVLHVHLDARNCLEVVVMKGKPARIRRIGDKLISTKGVKYGKLTAATIGENLS